MHWQRHVVCQQKKKKRNLQSTGGKKPFFCRGRDFITEKLHFFHRYHDLRSLHAVNNSLRNTKHTLSGRCEYDKVEKTISCLALDSGDFIHWIQTMFSTSVCSAIEQQQKVIKYSRILQIKTRWLKDIFIKIVTNQRRAKRASKSKHVKWTILQRKKKHCRVSFTRIFTSQEVR